LTLNDGSSICHKEIPNSVSNTPNGHLEASTPGPEDPDKQHLKANFGSSKPQPRFKSSKAQETPPSLTETSIQKELDVNLDDIAIFKRIFIPISDFLILMPIPRIRHSDSERSLKC
jgi:hypothetical protein